MDDDLLDEQADDALPIRRPRRVDAGAIGRLAAELFRGYDAEEAARADP